MDNTTIWQKYEAGKNQHSAVQMYAKTEMQHRMYEGDQWNGVQSGKETLPMHNILEPICSYKIAVVALNTTAIIYSPMEEDEESALACDLLTGYAEKLWEQLKMDTKKWEIVKNACITGDHYIYFYNDVQPSDAVVTDTEPNIKTRLIGKTSVYFADEQNPNIDDQQWIILSERLPVADVRSIAAKNGIADTEIAQILSDEADETAIGVKAQAEVNAGDGKCTCLLYMQKTETGVQFCRSTRLVVYEPMKEIPGLSVYPLCGMRWKKKEGSARGIGVVEHLIPNQIEINKLLARRSIISKRFAFPNVVYDPDRLANVNSLGKAGANIAVKGLANTPLASLVQYLQPPTVSNDAGDLMQEMIDTTRNLQGASDAATGQIDPEKTSGEAIKAARDQSAMPLTEQAESWKQCAEDIGRVWAELIKAYAVRGLTLNGEVVDPAKINADIRIDMSPVDPYSVLARETALENALAQQHITFEEYVSALDDNSGVPKDKLQKIIDDRQQMQPDIMPEMMPEGMPNEMPVM